MSSLQQTPAANRLHIAIYGRRNAGKSSLINALTNQPVALVSAIAGTTTDPVYKAMELPGLGACMFIDTAGFDDNGALGALRVQKTEETIAKADIALLLCTENDLSLEKEWHDKLSRTGVRQIAIINKTDMIDAPRLALRVQDILGLEPVMVSAATNEGITTLLGEIARAMPTQHGDRPILGGLTHAGDTVLLVMPQDSAAPRGRLILPQVQTIRELLDTDCISISATPDTMQAALAALRTPPALIITDSQVFHEVYEKTPAGSCLTSFSILFAAHKGDLSTFIEGAKAINHLHESSRVLIAEACTHAPMTEDIGRVKIPALLRRKFGANMQIDVVSGTIFPQDLHKYDLIVHCGGCMFSRTYLLSRIKQVQSANIPMTNYGILIAQMNGILDKVTLPMP